jgi:hypothetical protein
MCPHRPRSGMVVDDVAMMVMMMMMTMTMMMEEKFQNHKDQSNHIKDIT